MDKEKLAAGSRRNFLINPGFQLSFMAYTVGIAFVATGVFYFADLYFFYKFRQIGVSLGLSSDHVFFQFLREQESSKNFIYLTASLASLLTLSTWGLFLSHRVAGPLYRLCKHFDAVSRGETSDDVRFRDGDFFPEVAQAFNQYMQRQREKLGAASAPEVTAENESKAA